MNFSKQFTITKPLIFEGNGVHTGAYSKVTLFPEKQNEGIFFVKNNTKIPLKHENIDSTVFCTKLKKQNEEIFTVEHLLSAVYSSGISNLKIVVEGDEIPVLDGSSKLFFSGIIKNIVEQNVDREYITPDKTLIIKNKDKFILVIPSEYLEINYFIEYEEIIPGFMFEHYIHSSENYVKNISFARTFGFFKDYEFLKSKGLASGSSLDNTLVIDKNNYLNTPRDKNEPVKHKILDLMGDLSFLGKELKAHIIAFKTGHMEHIMMVKEILKSY